jgi:hypothetical protein
MGCIHPTAASSSSKNLVYTFNVTSLTGTTPEYHWEIMWKVQIFEQGVPKGYFYGGYDTKLSLVYSPTTGAYSYDSSASSSVWDLSDCTVPSPISLVSGLTVDGYSITDTDKKTLYSSENPFCSYTRAPTFSPSVVPTFRPTSQPSVTPSVAPTVSPSVSFSPTRIPSRSPTSASGGGGSGKTPSPTINSIVAQITASTDVGGLTSSDVDAGVISAFNQITADTLSISADQVNTTSVVDVSGRRLSSSLRIADAGVVRFTYVITVGLTSAGYADGDAAITAFQTLLNNKFSNATTGSKLISLALTAGSTTVTSSTVLVFYTTAVDATFTFIEVKTGTPTSAPVAGNGGNGSDDDGQDTTPIIIGAVVGGTVLLALVAVGFYFGVKRRNEKVNPS